MFVKRDILLWQISAFAFAALGGTLLHFLYNWTNESVLVSPFSAVNESTWEHMKLLYFPLFIFALIQSRFFMEYKNFWCVKFIGIITGLILIPTLFYTYNGAFGKSPDWLNIAIFFISAAIALILETWLFKNSSIECKWSGVAFGLLTLIGLLFVVFTFYTPQVPLFKDPLSGEYVISYKNKTSHIFVLNIG